MTTTLAFIAIAFLLLMGMVIAWPFLPAMQRRWVGATTPRAQGEEDVHFFVQAVRDLDSDFDTGKIAEADYIFQRKMLIGRGVGALMRLDEMQRQQQDADAEIEKLVAAARHKKR